MLCDPGFSLDTFYINKCNFCYPFLPLLGVLSGVKATLRLLPLVIAYSGTLRYDITLVLALLYYINTCQLCQEEDYEEVIHAHRMTIVPLHHLVVGLLRQTQFSSSHQVCHGLHLSSF